MGGFSFRVCEGERSSRSSRSSESGELLCRCEGDSRDAAQCWERTVSFAVHQCDGKELQMPRPRSDKHGAKAPSAIRDVLHIRRGGTNVAEPKNRAGQRGDWPPVPDLFDVITYFRS